MIHELFKIFTWMGSEWVLYSLFGLSVLTIWVILQRWFEIRKLTHVSGKFWDEQAEGWFKNADSVSWTQDLDNLKMNYPCLEADTLEVVYRAMQANSSDAGQVVAAYLDQRKMRLERFVAILGTIGANAPFIGLLGTVLGIIRAFHDMATSGLSGMESISGGIAEALVATAVGLMVAIPAVIFFNLLNKRIGTLIRRAQNMGMLALGQTPERSAKE